MEKIRTSFLANNLFSRVLHQTSSISPQFATPGQCDSYVQKNQERGSREVFFKLLEARGYEMEGESGRWEQGWIHGLVTCFHPKGPAVSLMLCSCHLEMLNNFSLNWCLVSEVWWDSGTCTWMYEIHMCVCNCLLLTNCHTVCRVLAKWLPWYTYFVLGAMCSEGLHTWFNTLWPSCNS